MEIGKNTGQNQINAYRQANPQLAKLSDEEILSVMNAGIESYPNSDGLTIFGEKTLNVDIKGLGIEHTQTPSEIDNKFRQKVNISPEQYTQIQEHGATERLSQDADAGLKLYNLAMDNSGVISKAWDATKNAFNGSLGSDKVYRQLVYARTTSKLLDEVQDGNKITAFDYVNIKMNELETFLGGLTDEEREQFEKIFLYEAVISNDELPGGRLNDIIDILVEFEADKDSGEDPLAQYENLTKAIKNRLKETYSKMSNQQSNVGDTLGGNLMPDFDMTVNNEKSRLNRELLGFNEVFSFERKTEFVPEKIEAYEKKEFEVKLRTQIDMQLRDYRITLESIAARSERQARQTQVPEMPSLDYFTKMYEREDNELRNIIKALVKDDEELKKLGIVIKYDENGEMDLTGGNGEYIAKKLLQKVNTLIENNLNGKTIEDYNKELEAFHDAAYGTFAKPEELAQRFEQSQEAAVENAKTVVMVGGIAISLASGGSAAPIVGMAIATLGPVAITTVDAATDKDGLTPEEQEIIGEELKTSLIFLPVGMGIGSTSAKIGIKALSTKLAQSMPKLTRAVAEYGSDAVMSTVADAMIMGDVTLEGESFNEILNIFTNAVSRGKMRRIQMKKAGHIAQNPKPELTGSDMRLLGENKDVKGFKAENVVGSKISSPNSAVKIQKNDAFFGVKGRFIEEYKGTYNVPTIIINGKVVQLDGITGMTIKAHENGRNKERFTEFLKTVDDVELLQDLNKKYLKSKSYEPSNHYDVLKTLYNFVKDYPDIPIKKLLDNRNLNINEMSYRQMTSKQVLYALNNPHFLPFSVEKKLKSANTPEDFAKLEIDILNLPDTKQKEKLTKLFEEKYDEFAQRHEIGGIGYKTYPSGKKYDFEVITPPKEKKFKVNNSGEISNQANLTNELQKRLYYRSDIENFYKNNPEAKRAVGALPQQWGTKADILSAEGFEKVDKIISDFAKEDFVMDSKSSPENLQQELQELLQQPVKVKYIGSGQIGHAYKLTIGDKSYKLKTYSFVRSNKGGHGNYNELAAGIYAQKHANKEFVKTYFGRFGENNDGYMVTDFLERDKNYQYPKPTLKSYLIRNLETHDHKQGENDIKGKEIDFGLSDRTSQSYLTHNGRKILRQFINALDNNSKEEMEKLIKTYSNDAEFAKVKDLIESKIDKDLLAEVGLEYLQDRAEAFNILGMDALPNIAEYTVFNYSKGSKFGFDESESREIDQAINKYKANQSNKPAP